MAREQKLSWDDLGEAFAAGMLLEMPPGTYYVVVYRRDDGEEFVEYIEEDEEQAAMATAAEWRRKGQQVAVWRRIE